jgi:hypothetical protein
MVRTTIWNGRWLAYLFLFLFVCLAFSLRVSNFFKASINRQIKYTFNLVENETDIFIHMGTVKGWYDAC